MAFGSGSKLYRPGELVPKAGIYKVVHKDHREAHEASLKAKETFPACRQCGDRVRFQIVAALEEKQNGEAQE